jgi:uncharacterized C2H2 Zn-finger protein
MENRVIMKCPICKLVLSNPNELREHRLKSHRIVFNEIKVSLGQNSE